MYLLSGVDDRLEKEALLTDKNLEVVHALSGYILGLVLFAEVSIPYILRLRWTLAFGYLQYLQPKCL